MARIVNGAATMEERTKEEREEGSGPFGTPVTSVPSTRLSRAMSEGVSRAV
jgi:hypothetical protein